MQISKNGLKSPCNRFYIGKGNDNVYLMQCLPNRALQTCGTLDALLEWMSINDKRYQFNLVQGNDPLQNWRR
jgi:hypothetical protein